ncbi:MAG: hypothetical protein JW720_04880 [Sedimentisphaerales bacterium]|nr:hypothetical protein [Sedimentisphaerales bacterium]
MCNGRTLILLWCTLLATGCSSNKLVRELRARGMKPSTIRKLVLQASEGDYGSDVSVAVTDREVIRRVWRSIERAEPYGRYSFCGVPKVKFYSQEYSDEPPAVLNLYCGSIEHRSSIHLEGMEPGPLDNSRGGRAGLYQCQRLHELVMIYLKEEYERRQGDVTRR